MGDQLAFDISEPTPSTERTTLTVLPEKPYIAPRLVRPPPTLAEIMFRPRSFAERASYATGLPLKVTQNAEQILDLYRCLTADYEDEFGAEAAWHLSWDELATHIGRDDTEKYARFEASLGGHVGHWLDSWLAAREVP